jgi:hypothetical protein
VTPNASVPARSKCAGNPLVPYPTVGAPFSSLYGGMVSWPPRRLGGPGAIRRACSAITAH